MQSRRARATTPLAAGAYERAAAVFEEMFAANPQNPGYVELAVRSHFSRALALQSAGDHAAAVDGSRRALDLHGRHVAKRLTSVLDRRTVVGMWILQAESAVESGNVAVAADAWRNASAAQDEVVASPQSDAADRRFAAMIARKGGLFAEKRAGESLDQDLQAVLLREAREAYAKALRIVPHRRGIACRDRRRSGERPQAVRRSRAAGRPPRIEPPLRGTEEFSRFSALREGFSVPVSASGEKVFHSPEIDRMKFLDSRSLLVASLAVVLSGGLAAQTPISGPQSGTLPAGVYVATGQLSVAAATTWTLSAGVIIKVSGLYTLTVNGTLLANGVAGNPVIFTDDADDTAGGDTNGGGPSVGVPSAWRGIVLAAGSGASVLTFTDVRYGGANSFANIGINGGEPDALELHDPELLRRRDAAHRRRSADRHELRVREQRGRGG